MTINKGNIDEKGLQKLEDIIRKAPALISDKLPVEQAQQSGTRSGKGRKKEHLDGTVKFGTYLTPHNFENLRALAFYKKTSMTQIVNDVLEEYFSRIAE